MGRERERNRVSEIYFLFFSYQTRPLNWHSGKRSQLGQFVHNLQRFHEYVHPAPALDPPHYRFPPARSDPGYPLKVRGEDQSPDSGSASSALLQPRRPRQLAHLARSLLSVRARRCRRAPSRPCDRVGAVPDRKRQ